MAHLLSEANRSRLACARRLLDRARASLDDAHHFGAWHAVVEACDAAELVLLVIADFKGQAVKEKQMFGGLIQTLSGTVPSVKTHADALYLLSTHRIGAKHKGIVPDRSTARASLDAAEVALLEVVDEVIGGGLEHSSMTAWFEHRLVANALERARVELTHYDPSEATEFVVALGEALDLCRMHAKWLLAERKSLAYGRQDSQRFDSRLDSRVHAAITSTAKQLWEEMDALRDEIVLLRVGAAGEDLALWTEYLPNVAFSGTGKVHWVTSGRPVPQEIARRLLEGVSRFAARMDGRHAPTTSLPTARYVTVTQPVDAMFGSGEHRRPAVRCTPNRRYAIPVVGGQAEEGYICLNVFGLEVEVPESLTTEPEDAG